MSVFYTSPDHLTLLLPKNFSIDLQTFPPSDLRRRGPFLLDNSPPDSGQNLCTPSLHTDTHSNGLPSLCQQSGLSLPILKGALPSLVSSRKNQCLTTEPPHAHGPHIPRLALCNLTSENNSPLENCSPHLDLLTPPQGLSFTLEQDRLEFRSQR